MARKITTVLTGPAKVARADGTVIHARATVTRTHCTYPINCRLSVDFEKLRASGELSEAAVHILEHGYPYPNTHIIFMGVVPIESDGKDICIGVKIGSSPVSYKDTFFISRDTMLDCCEPVEDEEAPSAT